MEKKMSKNEMRQEGGWMKKANEKENNGGPLKEGDRVKNVEKVEGTSHTQEYDVAHDMEAHDDVETYLATWHDVMDMQDDAEPCKKPNYMSNYDS